MVKVLCPACKVLVEADEGARSIRCSLCSVTSELPRYLVPGETRLLDSGRQARMLYRVGSVVLALAVGAFALGCVLLLAHETQQQIAVIIAMAGLPTLALAGAGLMWAGDVLWHQNKQTRLFAALVDRVSGGRSSK